MAFRYRRYRAYNFRIGRQASVRELELTAVLVLTALIVYFATRMSTTTLWIVSSGIALLGIIVGLISFTVFQRKLRLYGRALQTLEVIDIDHMSTEQFADYIETLLRSRGYQTMQTAHREIDGVAFIAQRGRKAVGVHLVRQSEPIRAAVVRHAIRRKAHYGYHRAMIITNALFTPAARRQALSHRCQLVDRSQLARWVLAFQEGG